MECINPDCTKADLLKKLFADEDKEEKLPKFCPFCGSPLRRVSAAAIEKTKEEATILRESDQTTGQKEERSSKENQTTVEDKNERKTAVKDEKPEVGVGVNNNLHSVHHETTTTESDATKEKQVPIVVKQHTSNKDVSCPSTSSDQGLQATLDTSSQEALQVHTDSSQVSSVDKTILPNSEHGGTKTSEKPKEDKTYASVIKNNVHSVHHATTTERDITNEKQVPDVVKQHTGSEESSCQSSSSDQGLQATSKTSSHHDPLPNQVHTDSVASSTVDKTNLHKSDLGGREIGEKSEVAKTHTSGQSNQIKEEMHNPRYNTRLQASLNDKQKQESKPNNQDSHRTAKNQHQSSDRRPDGISERSSKQKVSIIGTACVFGNSMPSSSGATGYSKLASETKLKQNHSQAKDQTSVNKDDADSEAISKGRIKSMDLNLEKNADKGSGQRQNDSKLSVQVTEADKSDSDSNTDQESESEEETKPSEQKTGPVPYDKDVIKQNKKKRKKRKNKGGKKTLKQEAKKEEKPQANANVDARTQMRLPPGSDKESITHGKHAQNQQNSAYGTENSREQLKDTQPKVNAPPPTDVTTEDCVTVIFHGLLSSDFHFDPKKQKISIRSGHEELGGWQWNFTNDFTVIGETKEKFLSIVGEMKVPIRFLHRALPYKYIIYTNNAKNQKIHWEYSEFRNDYPDIIVNRNLFLLEKYRTKHAIYHHYDGVIYPQPQPTNKWNPFTWITNPWHKREEFFKYRLHAAETFLPKWKGFVVHGEYEQMSAKEAIVKTQAISRCLTNVYICPGYQTQKKQFDGLDFNKILRDFLKPKLEYNAKLSKKDLNSSQVCVDRLVSSLAITHLIAYYKLDLQYFQLKDILHCLVIQADGSGGCDFDDIHKHFPEEMWSDLVKSILHLMKAANDENYFKSCPDIILAVPLLHFLQKDSKPLVELEVTHPKTAEEWCCAKGLPQNKTYNRFVESLLPEALPMFTLDPLLRRLFLHYTPLEDFPKLSGHIAFPVHEICTALFYKVRNVFTIKFDAVDETLSNLMKRQTSKQRQERLEQSEALLFAKLSMSLLQELVKKVEPKDKLFFTGIQFAIEALCSVGGPEDERKKMEKELQGELKDDDIKHTDIFYKIVDLVEIAVKKKFYWKLSSFTENQVKELEVWTALLNLNISKKNYENNWINSLVSLFEKRLKEVNDEDAIELFCKVEMDERFHQALVQSITQHAFVIVERIVEKGGSDYRSFTALQNRILRSGGSSKAGELLSRMITRAWRKATANKKVTDHDVLQYALTWRPWTGFFKLHGSQEKQRLLSQDANNLLQRVIGCLVNVQDALADGSIDVRTWTSLNQYEDNFIRLCSALSKIQATLEGNQKPHSLEDVRRNLEKRHEEYRLFHIMKEHVQHFIDICKSTRDSAFDIGGLQVKATCGTSNVRMVDLCKRVPSSDDQATERLEVVFFDCLPNMFHFILPFILDAYKSKTFQDIWKRNCKALYTEKKGNPLLSGEIHLTLLDVQEKVWPPSKEKWTLLAKTVYDGSISLKDVDRNFRKIDSKDLKEELDIMFRQTVTDETPFAVDQIARERFGQITRYRSLQNYIEAAETVWSFKEALGLSGDFGIIEELRDQVSEEFQDKDLKSINERFTKAGEYLNQISRENSHCLDAVIKCEPLVKWLRETIKDTSALSTLVDLAMISAGENDLEVDRISNFHTSCLSFAPLIFNLNEEFGFEDLMRACEPVWEAVKQDKKLSLKLAETCRHLEWLKAVQSSHGSVEMSSIMQAKAINSSGVFRIGQITQDPNGGLSVSCGKKDLENVLTLTVPIDPRTRDPKQQQEEEKEELKTYTLNDLKDLQSKLMLIAGKTAQLQNKDCIESTEEINRFVEVLEGTMRLGQVYIDLCEAGDVKYLDWSKEVHCSDNRLSTQRSVAEELAEASFTMEERLKKWQSHVHEKRHRYKQLNHYTTKQILVMRRELGLLREGASAGADMSLQVYTLLESVLPDITSQDLNQVLFETLGFKMDVRRTTMSDSLLPLPTPQQGSFRSANLREKFQPFLLMVEKMEFDEEVAIAALKANDVIKNHDVSEDNLIKWCMDKGEDEELVSEWFDKASEDKDFVDFFPDRWQDEEEQGEEEEEEQEQVKVEASVEEHQEEDFEQHPYLTLDELGSVLARLSSKCVNLDRRRFPEYLSREQPNLILVPKGDIIPTVLTLYMQYGGNSLPTANEVLVCTHETTAEEIELFWWRAFEDTNQQMFCLVHPDVLDYNVSQTAVNMLGILMREFTITAEGCRIIILCSTENEDRSHIIAALDEYRRNDAPSRVSDDVLSGYLTKQFTCSTSLTGYFNEERVSWIPAAHLDSDSLSVRLVCSSRAGAGKTLMITRLFELIPNLQNNLKVTKILQNLPLTMTVPLHGTVANTGPLLDGLWKHPARGDLPVSRIVHLDVSPSVLEGLETLLFNLLVLGVLCDNSGRLWRRKQTDLYMIEMTTPMPKESQSKEKGSGVCFSFVSLLPTTNCTTPRTTLQILKTNETTKSPLFEDQEYRSIPVQRVFQYLKACDDVRQSLDRFQFVPSSRLVGTQADCLALIIKYCGIRDPSWSELKHFVDFLNSQLHDCEENIFCNPDNVDDSWMQGTLKGFTSFVIRFMVTMSRDFATPSLDDDPIVCSAGLSAEDDDEDIRPLQLRRRWESSPHPYIFFNEDHITMTFLGFHINTNGDLIDPDTNAVIQSTLMTKQLRAGLEHQKVDFKTNYSAWTKQERIHKLCYVMGVKDQVDPDTSYELTIDNMKKILAIHMRFRCGIPVVIMGETGCGKTRLIRYMCALQAGPKGQRNMLLMKVHGGTSYQDITKKVEQAEKMAAENEKKGIDTVLFFDEANTTNALGMIKEVMVDRRINGRPVGVGLRRLHFIAACNPYRRHTDKMIKKLESAGLGYSVKSDETKDKLGKIPLRHLVYRVHALPASMRPLVWDFGQLKPDIEELYIRQIVSRYVLIDKSIPGNQNLVKTISNVLAAAQKYMRQQQDECSFVSLRDVERTMTVMTWFYQHHTHLRPQVTTSQDEDDDEDEDEEESLPPMDMITWSLVMSLGVCYHAKLQDREAFRKAVTSACAPPLIVNGGEKQMHHEIVRCQEVMINELILGPNIARNTALSENVFMMVVCIELRIPLFVIGKPGSSKSLAKTVVADNMQGDASKSKLFKTFKRAHMVSYQCSPLSTPDGIVATFRQCRRLQENNPGDRYASVVVLDEVGLAEDSPLMPLKTLHPLLEDGVTSSDDIIETDEKPTRVAFIGISNWALDPAKMNRGLMLMRGEPSKKELEDSAWGICAEREDVRQHLSTLLEELAAGYEDLYTRQKNFESLRSSKRDEFFGLRDFYSLVKMVYSIAAEKNGKPTWTELEHAIRRNFGGLDEIDAVEIFRDHISDARIQEGEPVDTLDLLRASLDHKNTVGESRYLLVLTENYSALRIVEQELIKNKDNYVVIFGSSFPKDQEYTQVCRNINQIKVCMETGRTVVLLNLESLYESLYDALNQYYVYCADQKYVDLGLGSHRVKCRVDDSFRLIVIAEKEVVYKKFPIPLINRLEKHYLVTSKSLRPVQLDLARDLKDWALDFAKVHRQRHETQQDFAIGDAFVGYQSDTIPAMVLQACAQSTCYTDEAAPEDWLPEVKERCQKLLLQCATPDAMARLSRTRLSLQAKVLWDTYFMQQEHVSLPACLMQLLDQAERCQDGLLVQVSTHSRLLSENDLTDVCQATHFKRRDVELLTLQQFQTEQQFLKQVREFFIRLSNDEGILLVQCDSGDVNFNLIACTRHLLMDRRIEREDTLKEKLKIESVPPLHVVIVIQLPRVKGGCVNFVGFQGGQWDSLHVDDLRPPTNQIPPIQMLIDRPISELLRPAGSVSREVSVEDEELQETKDHAQDGEETLIEEDKEDEEEEDVQTPNKEAEAMEIDEEKDLLRVLEQDRLSTNLGRFDPMVLLRRSVQAAAGRLKDDQVMAERKTERIDLILSLLPEDSSKMPDGPSFAKSLHWKIYNLLVEKNEKHSGDLARHWVRHEALSGTSVHERGTFRRALQHKVLTEVEPLLAKVFAYADRDCNLDLLRDQEPWILRLWIFIFNNKRLSEIFYEFSKTEQVQVSGKGKHVFRCGFPFSWLIKELIDELWRGMPQGSSRSNEREEDKLQRIMENSELRSILSVIHEEGKGDEAAKRYLHDFVHMVYKPNKENEDEEVKLVSRAIITAAGKRSSGELHLDFAAIHVAFNLIQSRLNNFNLLVQAEPGLTSLLLEHPNRQLTIDVAGLRACLEKLQPSLDDLESSEKRNEWCGRVLNIRKSIEAMTSKEVFSKKRGEIDDYEDREKELLQKCWEMWQRLSVVRLFIDHVCNVSQQTNAEDVENIFKLWKILGDDTNFLKAPCIRRLEGFLLECSQEHRKRNKCLEVTCAICLAQVKEPSVIPCGHCCCLECSSRWFSENSTCPSCRQPVPADYTPTESEHMREALNNVTTFRNQCNSFFMEVVSLFCFGYSPCGTLKEDTYELLMYYVTGDKASNTRRFSPFPDQGIDVNPVVRSFLLQQLLKSSDQKVKEYMDLFIKRAQDVVEMGSTSSVEVFVMCIQCMEDALNSKFIKRASGLPLDQKMRILEGDFKTSAALLSEAREDDTLDIKWLEGIANTRFVLSKAADFMSQYKTWSHPDVNRAFDRLRFELQNICVKTLLTTPRLFLLKQLSRKFGFESIIVLAEDFQWILPPEAKESSDVIQDRFLVYGLEYQRLRETISRAVISGDIDSIQEVLQSMTSSAHVINVALLLGIYQEVTTNKQVVIPETVKQSLHNFLQQSENQSSVLASDLMAETEGNINDVLRNAGNNTWDRSMVEIIVHLAAVLFSRAQDGLVGPLLTLALRPGATTDSFLPTMPDDLLQDVRSATVGRFYECPNGHPYVVTECGRPTEKSFCRAPGCRAEIGGTNHQLTTNNRDGRTTDLSKKGHCLGSPNDRGTEPIPEREMSALVTCLLRLLVHGSMLIGSCYHTQDMRQIISPAIPQESILGFLWKHAMCDLNLLSKVTGRSVDDTALIVHMVLHNISEHAPMYQGRYDTLKTKDERKQWENNFSTSLVVPLMTNLESSIQKTMELIVNDKRFGANPLLRQLYELESCVDDSNKIHTNSMALWRYRTPVTLDHVTRAFNESAHAQDEGCVVLKEFLKNEHKLRAVRFLPDVVKLQQLLMDRYHRTLDKTETEKLKWKDFEKRLPRGTKKEYKALRKSFRSAWDIMVAILVEQGTKGTLKKLLQYSVGDDSSISMFIPATSGLGTCSIFLLHFLVDAHNEFMEMYRQHSVSTPNLQSVPVTEVTCSQLVSYDADCDLLPLMQAHCHYSLEVGHGTLVEYDWTAIQRQLVDRLVRGRVLIDFKEGEYLKTAQISAESVLTTLKTKIPQVELSVAIQNQIIHQYRSLEDVCEALSSLNIAITFLASGGGKYNMLISKYIHRVLKLAEDTGLRNTKAQEVCQIQHAVSLWRLLSFERAKMLTKRKQDPFEHISPDFKVGPTEAMEISVNATLRKMSERCLDGFATVLLEVIVLRLNDSFEIDKDYSLRNYVLWYLDDKDTDPIPGVEDIPEEVLLKHIVRFWQSVFAMSDGYHDRRMEATG